MIVGGTPEADHGPMAANVSSRRVLPFESRYNRTSCRWTMRFPSARVWALSTVASKEKGAFFTTLVETPISPLTNWNPMFPWPTWAPAAPGGGITSMRVDGFCALTKARLPRVKPAKTKVRRNVLFMTPPNLSTSIRQAAFPGLNFYQADRDYGAKRIQCNICRDLPIGQ